MSRHAAPVPAGSCGTCRDLWRITNSPVVDGLCAWGHVDPHTWLAPLTKLEVAGLLELLTVVSDLASQVAEVARGGAERGDRAAIEQLVSVGAMWEDFADLRGDARAVFERKFFEVTP